MNLVVKHTQIHNKGFSTSRFFKIKFNLIRYNAIHTQSRFLQKFATFFYGYILLIKCFLLGAYYPDGRVHFSFY